jgi:hypothetical protein
MTARQRKTEKKREYDRIKDIRTRVATGQTTTFQERNQMYIYLKKIEKKKKSIYQNN